MTPSACTRLFSIARPAHSGAGLKVLIVALFLALQSFLVVHQFEHALQSELSTSEDCALCRTAAPLLPAPEPRAVSAPIAYVIESFTPAGGHIAVARIVAAGFLARAPPVSAAA